jgi:hypothetical protein
VATKGACFARNHCISAHDFAFQLQGRQASLDDVLPGFQPSDRIGVVVNTMRRHGGKRTADGSHHPVL